MSQLDFEKHFQERLEKRKLKPSEGSWEKLQQRLDTDTKKSKSIFWWTGLAASIVGGILIMSLVFQSSDVTAPPAIVDTPSPETRNEVVGQQRIVGSEPTGENEAKSEPVETATGDRTEFDGNNSRTMLAATDDKANAEENPADAQQDLTEEALAEADTEELEQTATIESYKNATDAEVEALLAEAMEELNKDQNLSAEFSDEDIEALLAEASEQLNREYSLLAAEASAAESLLQEVERELEDSFREKVFEVLKESFQRTRTAIANRNN